MKYKGKTVVEAIQLTKDNHKEVTEFTNGKASFDKSELRRWYRNIGCVVEAREGVYVVGEGDYIVKDGRGGFYSCSRDTFEQRYKEIPAEEEGGAI